MAFNKTGNGPPLNEKIVDGVIFTTGSLAPAKIPANIRLASAATKAFFIVSNLLNYCCNKMQPTTRTSRHIGQPTAIHGAIIHCFAEAYFYYSHYMNENCKS